MRKDTLGFLLWISSVLFTFIMNIINPTPGYSLYRIIIGTIGFLVFLIGAILITYFVYYPERRFA